MCLPHSAAEEVDEGVAAYEIPIALLCAPAKDEEVPTPVNKIMQEQ